LDLSSGVIGGNRPDYDRFPPGLKSSIYFQP
jgi:hypothetical protein